jgi:exonuclease SbcD
LNLAAPQRIEAGGLAKPGRLYLATGPTFWRLASTAGTEVQFILMPYPTPQRYLDGAGRGGASRDERNRALQAAYTTTLQSLLGRLRQDQPSVLAAHVHVKGAVLPNLFRISEREDVVFSDADLPAGFAYVALGHIHRPQCIGGLAHVRYCGSIERLDLGEQDDDKSVVLVDIGPEGRLGEPVLLPLEATPVREVVIDNPRVQLPQLRQRYPECARALVRYRLTWQAGVEDRDELLRELDAIFPRWYEREVCPSAVAGEQPPVGWSPGPASCAETVRSFLEICTWREPMTVQLL